MSPIKFMVVGDLHGDLPAAKAVVDAAVAQNVQMLVVTGDFGFVWPGFDSLLGLEKLNDYLNQHNRNLLFVRGNHEDHDALEAYESFAPRSTNGHVYVRSRVLYAPDGNGWTWAGKRFMAVGGAVSVDRSWRIEHERRKGERLWWPNEVLSASVAEGIINDSHARRARGKRGVDYLFTHDASDRTPWKTRLKPDLESTAHRQLLDSVLKAMQPRFHFHGHFHQVYDWMNPTKGSGMFGDEDTVWTQTYGLACNGFSNNWGVFDTELDDEADEHAQPFRFEKELTEGWNRNYFNR